MFDTNTETLKAKAENGILTIILNRPKSKNALTNDMLASLADILDKAQRESSIRCIVLTGAGQSFCSGGDVKAFAAANNQDEGKVDKNFHERVNDQRISQQSVVGRLYHMPKPTIAFISGAAAGAGLSIALACDLRIMSEQAILTTAFAKVGLSGDYGGTFLISQLIGRAKACELYFLSDRIGAGKALELGLVNWIGPDNLAREKLNQVVSELAEGPSVAYQYMKENLNRAYAGGDLEDCMDLEASHHLSCFNTNDHKVAAEAFVQKKKPQFRGY